VSLELCDPLLILLPLPTGGGGVTGDSLSLWERAGVGGGANSEYNSKLLLL